MLALIFGDELVRAAAQVQFIHAMATFACATVMNIGGLQARWAPGFFLPGSLAYAGAGYALAAGAPPWIEGLRWAGVAVLAAGWIVLALAAGRVDRPARLVVASDAPDARRTRVVAKRLRAI